MNIPFHVELVSIWVGLCVAVTLGFSWLFRKQLVFLVLLYFWIRPFVSKIRIIDIFITPQTCVSQNKSPMRKNVFNTLVTINYQLYVIKYTCAVVTQTDKQRSFLLVISNLIILTQNKIGLNVVCFLFIYMAIHELYIVFNLICSSSADYAFCAELEMQF